MYMDGSGSQEQHGRHQQILRMLRARSLAFVGGEGVTPASGLFGTTFFTLTGFHGLHVLGGLITLAILLGLAQAGVFALQRPHSTALEATSLYWHFVDVVWIAVFTIVYLWTLVSR